MNTDKGEIHIVSIGPREKREFDSQESADACAGLFMFTEVAMFAIEQLGPGMEQFGACPEWDFIKRIDGKDATAFRLWLFRDRVKLGIERPGDLELFCPHTGEGWKVEFRIVKRAPDAVMTIEEQP